MLKEKCWGRGSNVHKGMPGDQSQGQLLRFSYRSSRSRVRNYIATRITSKDRSVKSTDQAKLKGYYRRQVSLRLYFVGRPSDTTFSNCMQSDEVDILGALTSSENFEGDRQACLEAS